MIISRDDYGVVYPVLLATKIDEDSVLLINSLSGYFAEQPMKKISEVCRKKNCLLFNDASGSIGTDLAKYGDIVFGSFSEEKPIWVGKGGFIGFDDSSYLSLTEMTKPEFDLELLKKEIDGLSLKLEKLHMICEKIKEDLSECDILYPKDNGLVVVVRFNSIDEKNKLIEYCSKNKYEHEICPRNIRVECDAVSIEVKRLKV